jgi:hypothetical protein
MNALPAEEWVRSTAAALWAYSNDFIEKDDIANGTVGFSGSASYSQLAKFMGTAESTAKWRMNQMRDRYELTEWERMKFGINFTFGVYLSADGENHSAKRGATSRPGTFRANDWVEKFRMPLTPAQQACEDRDAHVWVDILHTTQQCSACGKIRANLPPWTADDDLEAEYMAWLEEDAPDHFPDPLASYESVDYPPPSAAFLAYLEGSPMRLWAEKGVR